MKTLIFAFFDDTQDLSNLTEYALVLLTNLLFRVDPFVFSREERSTGSLISPFFTRFTGFSFRLLILLTERKKKKKVAVDVYTRTHTDTRARDESISLPLQLRFRQSRRPRRRSCMCVFGD